ncbi:MAG: GNAT family N-acetyltransferase [Pseudomonadales bacterium]|nr:GNAT family N-acetyltransferase [Pseudomonadales bacterium]
MPFSSCNPERRLEEAALNAWPALTELLYDGWVLRLTRGFTRRANSVTPLFAGGARPLEAKIDYCETLYRRRELTPCFRLPDCVDTAALGSALRGRGYGRVAPSRVLARALAPTTGTDPDAAAVRWLEAEAWLRAYGILTGAPESVQTLHGLVLGGIAGHCLFAVLRVDDVPRACVLGVVEDDLLGLFDLVTARDARRQGHARTLLRVVCARGAALGARRAYLQVDEENDAALQLYSGMGFEHAYGYVYMVPNA